MPQCVFYQRIILSENVEENRQLMTNGIIAYLQTDSMTMITMF